MAVGTVATLREVGLMMEIALMALAAGWRVGAVAESAVGSPEVVSVRHMQCAARSTLEAGVALRAIGNLRRQRSGIRGAGGMATLTVIDKIIVEHMPGATTVAEVVTVYSMALSTGRGIITMADGAVAGADGRRVTLVQLSARPALEAGVAGVAFPERLAQRTAGRWGGDMAELAIVDEVVMEDMS